MRTSPRPPFAAAVARDDHVHLEGRRVHRADVLHLHLDRHRLPAAGGRRSRRRGGDPRRARWPPAGPRGRRRSGTAPRPPDPSPGTPAARRRSGPPAARRGQAARVAGHPHGRAGGVQAHLEGQHPALRIHDAPADHAPPPLSGGRGHRRLSMVGSLRLLGVSSRRRRPAACGSTRAPARRGPEVETTRARLRTSWPSVIGATRGPPSRPAACAAGASGRRRSARSHGGGVQHRARTRSPGGPPAGQPETPARSASPRSPRE